MSDLIVNENKPIGVFDSGLGGLSVLATLKEILPNEKYIYYGDSLNAPYGIKTTQQVIKHSDNIVKWFIKRDVKAVVIACNTATSAAADYLRDKYDIPIIGMEPAVKPAIHNINTKKIAVMATDMTLREKKFQNLLKNITIISEKDVEKESVEIIKIPCSNLVQLVENSVLEGKKVEGEISKCFINQGIDNVNFFEIDAVVLGCTHFSFLKKSIRDVFNNDILIYDGNMGTAKHLKNILKQKNCINNISENINEQKIENANIEIYNSKSQDMIDKSWDIFKMALINSELF